MDEKVVSLGDVMPFMEKIEKEAKSREGRYELNKESFYRAVNVFRKFRSITLAEYGEIMKIDTSPDDRVIMSMTAIHWDLEDESYSLFKDLLGDVDSFRAYAVGHGEDTELVVEVSVADLWKAV